MIHHTRGVYPNGEYKDNGVACEDIASHIWYNLSFRPGRALFVDGMCLYKGLGISEELIAIHLEQLKTVKAKRVTIPYV